MMGGNMFGAAIWGMFAIGILVGAAVCAVAWWIL